MACLPVVVEPFGQIYNFDASSCRVFTYPLLAHIVPTTIGEFQTPSVVRGQRDLNAVRFRLNTSCIEWQLTDVQVE